MKIDMHQLYNLKVVSMKGDCCSHSTSNDHNALLTPQPGVTYPDDGGLKSSKWSHWETMVPYLVSTVTSDSSLCMERSFKGVLASYKQEFYTWLPVLLKSLNFRLKPSLELKQHLKQQLFKGGFQFKRIHYCILLPL